MAIGGVAIEASLAKEFEMEIEKLRHETNMHKELKWSRVTKQKFEEYKRFVDLFFEWNKTSKLYFHCLIIDNTRIDHRLFSGSYELGFYKMFYQLLLWCFGRPYGKNHDLYVFLDQRQTGYRMDDLRKILNDGMNKRLGIDRRPFRLVEPSDSKRVGILQISDIILGALAYRKNNKHETPGTKEAKIHLSAYVLKNAKLKSNLPNTPYLERRFTVWNFQLR